MNSDKLIERDPEKMSGTPVFYGTRVPIKNLFDCLEAGEGLDEFLDQFPTVSREQALQVLENYKEWLLSQHESAADVCVTRFVKRDLVAEHEVLTVDDAGLKGLKNGDLLRAAAAVNFDALVTVDKNILTSRTRANWRLPF